MPKSKIYIPILDHYIHVILEDEIEEALAYVNATENKVLYAVFQRGKITPSLIVHETVHLVNAIFMFKGITPTVTNDETQAYLTEYIFYKLTEILNKLEKKGKV